MAFMEQQYQSFQATSEILLSDLKNKIDTECSSIMEKDEKITELNNQIESLSYQVNFIVVSFTVDLLFNKSVNQFRSHNSKTICRIRGIPE